jgi:hypothetical protein
MFMNVYLDLITSLLYLSRFGQNKKAHWTDISKFQKLNYHHRYGFNAYF